MKLLNLVDKAVFTFMICQNCGTIINDASARFCPNCGAPLAAQGTEPDYTNGGYQQPPYYQQPYYQQPAPEDRGGGIDPVSGLANRTS